MIRSDLYAEDHGGVLQEGLAAAEEPVWVINPTAETITELVTTVREQSSPIAAPVRLFAAREPLKQFSKDFVRASLAAELVAEGPLEIRTLGSVPHHSLLLTERALVSLVECQDHVVGLTTTDDEVVESAHGKYTERWERAEEFSFRTPPLSEIRGTLESELGPEVVEDFDRALAALDAQHDEPTTKNGVLDEVTITLLVAANNEELLYDISRWGEDIRLASKATFSRSKKRLEEADLVDTEKVPIDVGRPRLRLVPGEELPATADIEQFVQDAQKTLE